MRSSNTGLLASIALAMIFVNVVQAKPFYSGRATAFKPIESLCLRQNCPSAALAAEMLRGGSTEAEEEEETDSEEVEVSLRFNVACFQCLVANANFIS